jgi:UDP-3-O-[3-hydroxymyristoyl] N-acetylglucosamine deacetylase/3-hydroxyacyl-[acyl-carrier-protein] dehydratase
MRNQRTLREPVEITGVGLHTGQPCTLRIRPAEPDTGVVFVRSDLKGSPRIPASIDNVSPEARRTALENDGGNVHTVEHFLAALAGLRVDNLEIEVLGPEIPGADGSARPFFEALRGAGVVDQKASRKDFTLDEPVAVAEGDATLVAMPCPDRLSLAYTLDYGRQAGMPPQFFSVDDLTEDFFAREIAPARTFCLASEVEELRGRGLGKGATPENTVVLGDAAAMNGLRFRDEPARHKLLDLVGDLFLLGVDLKAQIVATKTGHRANAALVQKLRKLMRERENRGLLPRDTGIDIREIMRILPHRFPFLLVDRVIEVEGIKRAVGIKNVTINEPFFQGHYPGQPIMPGVLQIEAMAQMAGVLLLRKLENTGRVAVLLSIDKVKLRRPVMPGDQLRLEAEALKVKTRLGYVHTRALVNDDLTAEAFMKFMLMDAD